MAAKSQDRETKRRIAQMEAKRALRADQIKRRKRDNVIGAVVIAVLVILGVLLQLTVPVGVVGVISQWNWKLQLSNRSLARELAFGICFVLKPASDTPARSAKDMCLNIDVLCTVLPWMVAGSRVNGASLPHGD